MATEERPPYLRPVPSGDEATARKLEEEVTNNGVTPPMGRGRAGMFISDVIVDLGYASRERVDEVVNEARVAGRAPEALLRELQVIDGDRLSRAIAERYGLDHIDLSIYKVDMGAANLLSMSAARRYKALPVGYVDKDTLLVAMADPANVLAVDDIQMLTNLRCHVAVAAEEDIDALISRMNRLENAVSDAVLEEEEAEGDAEITELHETADDAPVIKLVHSILAQAVSEGASDIHFEPEEGEMRVRFRVDGVLYESARVPKRMIAGVVSRVKLMADMDIAEKRIPQDGRVSVTVEDRGVDLRVTTLPTSRGEGASVRILDKDQALRTLDELGMDGSAREAFEMTVQRPYGAALVTGPTGSGKSTTLYAGLLELNAVERNIITIEDPVEYRVAGVNQMNVNRKAGLTFATGLRSILRADPDVIMVGEIRDAETARIAVESALTGHMVLSTLHTNDAPGAIARLTEMGIESFLTASAVECVVAQRLARQLCTYCKRRTVIPQRALVESGFRVGADLEAYEAVGCARCSHSGYRGRIGLFSVMLMSEEIKSLTVQRAPEAEIAEVARSEGMITVREDGLRKARAGVTSIEEIARVTT